MPRKKITYEATTDLTLGDDFRVRASELFEWNGKKDVIERWLSSGYAREFTPYNEEPEPEIEETQELDNG